MKTVDETTLAAWVDGELDAAPASRVADAVAADAALTARAAQLRSQRERLRVAFDGGGAGAEDDPAPETMQRAAAALADRLAQQVDCGQRADDASKAAPATHAAPAAVLDLDAVRRARQSPSVAPSRGWAPWWGLAASLVLGLALGLALAPVVLRSGSSDRWFTAADDGRLVATGALAQALQRSLASEPARGFAVQLSFVGRDGGWCRTFSAERIAGLACRTDHGWTLQTLAAAEPAPPGALRQAATSLPREVLDAVERLAAAPPVAADAERAARDAGWSR